MRLGLVRIIKDDDGDERPDWKDWHLVDPGNPGGPAATCTGEYFGAGESAVEYELKPYRRGGITCKRCIERVKVYKAIKL